jgi:hypothetical protein
MILGGNQGFCGRGIPPLYLLKNRPGSPVGKSGLTAAMYTYKQNRDFGIAKNIFCNAAVYKP